MTSPSEDVGSRDLLDSGFDGVNECLDGSRAHLAKPGLEFRPRFLDGVELRGVGRDVDEGDLVSGRQRLDRFGMMAPKVVHDDRRSKKCRKSSFFMPPSKKSAASIPSGPRAPMMVMFFALAFG